jgi:uncharacterized protein YdeI (BOF family)
LDVLQIPCQRGSNVTSGSEMQVGRTIQLIGASLRNISEVSYEIADGTGEIKTFTATFAYHFYRGLV